MTVEREAIIGYFNISRWKIADRIMPQQFNLPHPPTAPAWSRTPIAERRVRAAGVIARWQSQHGGAPVTLSVAIPRGPGADLLFLALKGQYRRIGVGLERTERNADLKMYNNTGRLSTRLASTNISDGSLECFNNEGTRMVYITTDVNGDGSVTTFNKAGARSGRVPQ